MSRERKLYRDARRSALREWYWNLIEQIARLERRRLASDDERIPYARDLHARGVIIDLGPHPSGQGRSIRFQLEEPESDQEGCPIRSLDEFLGLFGVR